MSYQFSSELITPEMAEIWLQGMKSNRPVSLSNVKFLADQIREGKWVDTGVPIVFVGENLIDGQHRLRAILETKKTIRNAVVRHPKNKNQDTIFPVLDTGSKRTPAQVLSIAGHKSYKLLAETLRHLAIWNFVQNEALIAQSDFVPQVRLFNVLRHPNGFFLLDNATYLDLPNRFVNVEASVKFGGSKQDSGNPTANDPLPRGKWAFFHYVLHSIDTEHADEFLLSLHKGVGRGFASSGQPLAQLREFLIARQQAKKATLYARDGSIQDIVDTYLHIFSSWNATRGLGTYKASKLNGSSPIPIPR